MILAAYKFCTEITFLSSLFPKQWNVKMNRKTLKMFFSDLCFLEIIFTRLSLHIMLHLQKLIGVPMATTFLKRGHVHLKAFASLSRFFTYFLNYARVQLKKHIEIRSLETIYIYSRTKA